MHAARRPSLPHKAMHSRVAGTARWCSQGHSARRLHASLSCRSLHTLQIDARRSAGSLGACAAGGSTVASSHVTQRYMRGPAGQGIQRLLKRLERSIARIQTPQLRAVPLRPRQHHRLRRASTSNLQILPCTWRPALNASAGVKASCASARVERAQWRAGSRSTRGWRRMLKSSQTDRKQHRSSVLY